MKLFCMSDTHGGPPPAKALSLPHGTVMLHAGDFYNEGSTKVHSDWTKVIGGDTGNDILMVRGNHDCVETDFIKGHDLTMGFSRVEKTWIVGLGWCGQEYNQLPPEALMTKLVLRLLDACSNTFKAGDRSILVTHYLPTGPHFKNCEGWEFKSINSLIDAIRPMAVIAGHRHGLAGKTFYQGDVPIIFPGPKGGWLEVEEGGVKWSR
jgi:Icc-related predicted phosphoesterase